MFKSSVILAILGFLLVTLLNPSFGWVMKTDYQRQIGFALPLNPEFYKYLMVSLPTPQNSSSDTYDVKFDSERKSLYVDISGNWEDEITETPEEAQKGQSYWATFTHEVRLAISGWMFDKQTQTLELLGYSLEDNVCENALRLHDVAEHYSTHRCEIGRVLPYLFPFSEPEGDLMEDYTESFQFVVGIQIIVPGELEFRLKEKNVSSLLSTIPRPDSYFWSLNTTRYLYRRAQFQLYELLETKESASDFLNNSALGTTLMPKIQFVESWAPLLNPVTLTQVSSVVKYNPTAGEYYYINGKPVIFGNSWRDNGFIIGGVCVLIGLLIAIYAIRRLIKRRGIEDSVKQALAETDASTVTEEIANIKIVRHRPVGKMVKQLRKVLQGWCGPRSTIHTHQGSEPVVIDAEEINTA